MSTIFARTQQTISKRTFSQQFLLTRRWETSGQYLGYVSYFNHERLSGLIVREDAPEHPYRFNASDVHVATVPNVRKFQQVSFHGMTRQGTLFAKDVTAPNGEPLVFMHRNQRLPRQQRTKKLTTIDDWETKRFKGIVKKFDGSSGYICPIDDGYTDLYFTAPDLQTTGKESVPEGAEVEFSVRSRSERREDRAVNITRPGGGLITEDGAASKARRLLGAMYKDNDTKARIPSEYTNSKLERRQGYVVMYNTDYCHGYILPFEEPFDLNFVSVDDCHMYGKRALRKYQLVEFYSTNTSSGETRAAHVTGPDRSILHFNSPNAFVPDSMATKHFEPSDTEIHRGIISSVSEKTFFFIKPDEVGYAPVFAHFGSVRKLQFGRPQPGIAVEFTVVEGKEDESGSRNTKAGVVTAPGGYPFCEARGNYGKYLACRMHLAKPQEELPEVPLENEKTFNGWISSFNSQTKKGVIEVQAPEGERYRKVAFEIQNVNLGDQMFNDQKLVPTGAPVTMELRPIPDSKRTHTNDEGVQIESVFSQEAFNVVSQDASVLKLKDKVNYEERPRKQKKAV